MNRSADIPVRQRAHEDPMPTRRLVHPWPPKERTRLDELERIGRWFSCVTQSPDYPDAQTAELIQLRLQDLQDRRALWHGKEMSKEEADRIIEACFPE